MASDPATQPPPREEVSRPVPVDLLGDDAAMEEASVEEGPGCGAEPSFLFRFAAFLLANSVSTLCDIAWSLGPNWSS